MPITIDQLRRAVSIAEEIQKLEEEYAAILGGKPAPVAAVPAAPTVTKTTKRGRKPFSAESRAKMAAAQKARWAKKGGAVVKTVKRTILAEDRAKLVAAAKLRWGKKKGG